MKLPSFLCSLLHRKHWHFAARKETGPAFLRRQRHMGIYECEICSARRAILGDRLQSQDAYLPLDAQPPIRGMAMRLHKLLGGSA